MDSFPPARLFAVLALALAMTFSASNAFADHPRRNLDVELDYVDVRVDHGKLRVTYTIDRDDWYRITKRHIRPRLNLYTPYQRGRFSYAHSVPVHHRTATIYFPHDVTPTRGKFVELRLSGERGRTRIATTSYNGDCAQRVRVEVVREVHHSHGHGHGHGHGHSHGKKKGHGHGKGHVHGKGNAKGHKHDDYVRDRKRDRRFERDHRAEIIAACDRNTSWSGELNHCIDRAVANHYTPSLIDACGGATSWSGEFHQCLTNAAPIRGNRVATIQACDDATSWSGEFNMCLQKAQDLGRRAPGIVDACDHATSWSGEFQQCLDTSRRS